MRLPLFLVGVLLVSGHAAQAQEPLHKRIDALVSAKAKGAAFSPVADDAEFLRRAYLDFAGRIPTAQETRAFLADKAADKRVQTIDRLLNGPEYAVRMQEAFGVMLMERLGDGPDWSQYLQTAFQENRSWDQMAREILGATHTKAPQGAAFFLTKRLENFGQNPVDYPALTRDIGRLFLGKDFRCAQCHNHLTIKDYSQRDFQGLYAFVKNISIQGGAKMPVLIEKPTVEKIEFASVFGGGKLKTGPRMPGREEIEIPTFKKGEEYEVKPDPKQKLPGVLKFSTLAALAEQATAPDNDDFSRNIANRLWFLVMGRGVVHPLDLHHGANPPSHPELLDLLAKELHAKKYDMKWLLRELALSETYQRSSRLPAGVKEVNPAEFRTALERRLEPEQLLRAMLEATGEKAVQGGATFDAMKPAFLKAFAYGPREPEEEFSPSLKAALFLLNDKGVLGWLTPKPGNLLDSAGKIDDDRKAVESLYLRVLSRLPTPDELEQTAKYLGERRERRPAALRNLAWALLGSTEFAVNH